MSNKALIIIDLQNDYFADGKFPLEGTQAAADNAARLLAAARAAGDLVVHVQHVSTEADASFFAPDTRGVEINATVARRDGEPLVIKHVINAFQDTNLKAILDERGVTDVVIAGAMSHMCIEGATRAAVDFGYATKVIHDAVATRALEFNGVDVPAAQVHAASMAALAFGYAEVVSTADYLAA